MRTVLPMPRCWLQHTITAYDELAAMVLLRGLLLLLVPVIDVPDFDINSLISAAAFGSCTSHPACQGCIGRPNVLPAIMANHAVCSYKNSFEAHLARSCQRPSIATEDHLGKNRGLLSKGYGHASMCARMTHGALLPPAHCFGLAKATSQLNRS